MNELLRKCWILLFCLCVFCHCKKNVSSRSDASIFDPSLAESSPAVIAPDSVSIPFPVNAPLTCTTGPNYGGNTIYLQPATGSDYKIKPQNALAQGKFYAWPAGLNIDVNTGELNLTKSVTGVQYAVGYIKNGTTDTCLQSLTLSGASYKDSIYYTKGPKMAHPYFDGRAAGGPVCGPAGECAWDLTGAATAQKVHINLKNGDIDLQASLDQKMFGEDPSNGAQVNSTIYYHLKDQSNGAIQSMTLQFIYYNRLSDVPATLQNQILTRSSKIATNSLISTSKSPRPPIIVIIRNTQ